MAFKDQWNHFKHKFDTHKHTNDEAYDDDDYEYEEYDEYDEDDFSETPVDEDEHTDAEDDLMKTTIYHGNFSEDAENSDPEEEALSSREDEASHETKQRATFVPTDLDEDESEDDFERLNRRQYARQNSAGPQKGITPTKKILMFACLLFILLPIVATAIFQNRNRTPEPESAEQVMVSKTENESAIEASKKKASESKAKAESESQAKADSESKAKADSEAKESSALAASQAAEASRQAEQQAQSSQATQATSQKQDSGNHDVGTYTVSAGDNLYRIAVNHGMTLDQLLSLNGLSSSSNIAPGTVLRVYQ